ncbi:MAG: exodeoxyribonuclease VII large subunit, partial [Bacteroidetes bacterium]|nr:exodeoxyribonuclease VII large subunit [Bacteroidota bacterium]
MNHLSLFELNRLIKSALDNNLAPSYWVVCEISDLRENQRGHCYLELVEKEGDEVIAKMRGVIWANNYRNLSTWFYSATGQTLKTGLKILANVQIQFHEIFGLNLNIRDIDASFTLGEKEKQKHIVIDQLIEEGVFEINKTLNFPIVPQNIAIISSPTAAGYEDFINHLKNNQYGYRFTAKLYKSIMQGDEAIPSIIESLHRVNNLVDRFDILVLIRGGGSRVDLDCFDSYDLSSHIAQFPIPVVTGIGHERDESICDLVAHTNLKTPTAVSEFIINQVIDFENSVQFAFDKINSGTKVLISNNANILNQFGFRINVS